ncbi:carnitine dehydratase [Chromatiales bacterium (ex Bugula neritina AB1)]|nr:carnitine dehydratase [Chromatiales bacterium (ex Bugula neritina AB1)]
MSPSESSSTLLQSLWSEHKLPQDTIAHIRLTGTDFRLPSSFAVSTIAQSTIAAAAGIAIEMGYHRSGHRQHTTIDSLDASMECSAFYRLNGKTPPQWAELSGLYQTADGFIRVHANFDHHRDIALEVLGLPAGTATNRDQTAARIQQWKTQDLDDAISNANGVCSSYRSFDEWDAHLQARALAALPLVEIEKIGEAPPRDKSSIDKKTLPLSGIRVLDLTRILAGPVCGRTLAAFGADVMLVNSPTLPNIDSIIDTSRGKLSTLVDLKTRSGFQTLQNLTRGADIFIQGYRPGGLAELGFSPEVLCAENPGLIYTSLSAYGRTGPWRNRRGFDSLVQTATGFNHAEAIAFGMQTPKALPVQILDYATGYLMAFGSQVALYRQLIEGGSWHVQVSLARTGHWLRSLARTPEDIDCAVPNAADHLEPYDSHYGALEAIPHAARLSDCSTNWNRPSVPPGTHQPVWP